MLTLALYTLLAVAVMAAVFFVVAAVLPAGEQIAPPVRDERPWELPVEHAMGADDVATVRLPVALRGYRFAETDLLLDRLAEELRARDEVIAHLRGEAPVSPEPERPDESNDPLEPADGHEEPGNEEPGNEEPGTEEPGNDDAHAG